jgi:hypothetical protein
MGVRDRFLLVRSDHRAFGPKQYTLPSFEPMTIFSSATAGELSIGCPTSYDQIWLPSFNPTM